MTDAQLDDRHIVRRMVLKKSIFGVDKNAMAVELAKTALWLHTFTVGAPLSFLDHHLKTGDSLHGERLPQVLPSNARLTALQYNPKETADNLKKSGAFVPGIRPGDQTARYLEKILTRLTLAGAIYVTLVCLVPEFLILKFKVPFYFGGTSLLIIVVVTMDFMAQVQNYLMSQQYDSLLKKANFKSS